jgi:glyoxylase-like metal-dependent hydrolase (beta-lactamase superfamily II)
MKRVVARGVHQLPVGSHAYLVDGDEGVTLVDTGLPGHVDVVIDTLAHIGRTPQDVTAVLITHAHSDHTGSAAAVRAATGAPVSMSARDAVVARGEAGTEDPPLLQRLGPLSSVASRLLPEADPVVVDHEVSEGERTGLPEEWFVVATPGHTSGHVSYLLDRMGGLLFAGDAAMVDRHGRVGRGWMNAGSAAVDASIHKLAQLHFRAAYFGHGGFLSNDAAAAFRRYAAGLG